MKSVRFVILAVTLGLVSLPFVFLGIAFVYERALIAADRERLQSDAARLAGAHSVAWKELAARERVWVRAVERSPSFLNWPAYWLPHHANCSTEASGWPAAAPPTITTVLLCGIRKA